MKAFDKLIEIVETLLGDKGCPWDKKQTLHSLKKYLIEETAEVVDAIDSEDNNEIKGEFCDLFFNAYFLARIAEKEGRFTVKEMLDHLNEKLVRRHPHVFGDAHIETLEDLKQQWKRIKQQEQNGAKPSLLDAIPKELPPLAKAQRMLDKMEDTHYQSFPTKPVEIEDEETLGSALFNLVHNGAKKGLNAELSLRKTLYKLEQEFRMYENERQSC